MFGTVSPAGVWTKHASLMTCLTACRLKCPSQSWNSY